MYFGYAQYKQKGRACRQAGFAPILILVGIVTIIGVAGGVYFFGKSQTPKSQNQVVSPTPQPTSVPSSIPATSPTSTTKPTDSGRTAIVPSPLINTSGWQRKTYSKLSISLSVPKEWGIVRETNEEVFFAIRPLVGSGKNVGDFIITVHNNPKNLGRREFLWQEKLGMTTNLSEAIRNGSVDTPKEWLIDGIASLSLLYRSDPSYPTEFTNILAIPVGNRMIVISVWDQELTKQNPQLFTVLSTIKISR